MTESCETSLRELGLDAVDLLQLHLYWPTWGHDGYWMKELQQLKQIPICRANNVAVIARCILDEGGLTGSLTEDAEFPPGDFRHGYFDWTVPRKSYMVKVDALRPYVPRYASSLAALAVKFAVHDPGVTTAITSMHVHARPCTSRTTPG